MLVYTRHSNIARCLRLMICIDYTLWVEFIAKKPAVATTLTGVALRNRLSIVVCQHVLLKHVICHVSLWHVVFKAEGRPYLVFVRSNTSCLLVFGQVRVDLSISNLQITGDTWLILPVVICLSQRLSHASLSICCIVETADGSLKQL